MFSTWQKDKAILALVDEAQALADKLASAKPHQRDACAAHAQFWAVSYGVDGVDLTQLATWKSADVTRWAKATLTRINALRKQRLYDMADGLAVWLHTARAITEPRITPAAQAIWRRLAEAGLNAMPMADDLLAEAGLPTGQPRHLPHGMGPEV